MEEKKKGFARPAWRPGRLPFGPGAPASSVLPLGKVCPMIAAAGAEGGGGRRAVQIGVAEEATKKGLYRHRARRTSSAAVPLHCLLLFAPSNNESGSKAQQENNLKR